MKNISSMNDGGKKFITDDEMKRKARRFDEMKRKARQFIDIEKREPLQKWVIPDGVKIIQDDGLKKVVVVGPRQCIVQEMIYRTRPTNFYSFPGVMISYTCITYMGIGYKKGAAIGYPSGGICGMCYTNSDMNEGEILHWESIAQSIIEKNEKYPFLKKEFPFDNKFPTSPLPQDIQIRFLGFCDNRGSAKFEIIVF